MISIDQAARQVMALYPRIYFACHSRHVRDPQSHRLLSRHQASILDHLDEVEPTTLNGLAAHMGVTAATMSLGVDRLERKGYVVRLRDVADRRRVHLRLTSAGVRVREASSVLDPPRVAALVARLSDDERARPQMRRPGAAPGAGPTSPAQGGPGARRHVMKWLLIVGVVFIAIVALAALVGTRLPRDHRASKQQTFPVPPEAVWAVITDVEAYPAWRSDVKESSGFPIVTAATCLGRRRTVGKDALAVERMEPPRLLVARIADRTCRSAAHGRIRSSRRRRQPADDYGERGNL